MITIYISDRDLEELKELRQSYEAAVKCISGSVSLEDWSTYDTLVQKIILAAKGVHDDSLEVAVIRSYSPCYMSGGVAPAILDVSIGGKSIDGTFTGKGKFDEAFEAIRNQLKDWDEEDG